MLKGWPGVIVILGCLALLAFLAFALKAEAAVVAAVAAVQILIAWITHPPQDTTKPPPPAAILCVVGISYFLGACATLAAQKQEAEAEYLGEQLRCVDKAPTREQADACRRAVRERWGIVETQTSKDGSR